MDPYNNDREEIVKAGSLSNFLTQLASDPSFRGGLNDSIGHTLMGVHKVMARQAARPHVEGSAFEAVRRLEAMKGLKNGPAVTRRAAATEKAMENMVNAYSQAVAPGQSPIDFYKAKALSFVNLKAKEGLEKLKGMKSAPVVKEASVYSPYREYVAKQAALSNAAFEAIAGGIAGAGVGAVTGARVGQRFEQDGDRHPVRNALLGAAVGGAGGAAASRLVGHLNHKEVTELVDHTTRAMKGNIGMAVRRDLQGLPESAQHFRDLAKASLAKRKAYKDRLNNPWSLSVNMRDPKDVRRALFE